MAKSLEQFETFMRQELPDMLQRFSEMALEKTGAHAVSELSKLFKTEGKSLHANWTPLKEKTLTAKLKKGYSEKILHRTTTLAQSFSYDLSDKEVVIGTPVAYALYHEYGAPGRNIPPRPFMEPVAKYLAERGLKKIFTQAFREVFG